MKNHTFLLQFHINFILTKTSYGPNILWEYNFFLSLYKEIQKAVKPGMCNAFLEKVVIYFPKTILQENYLLVILGFGISFSFQVNVALKRPLWPLIQFVSCQPILISCSGFITTWKIFVHLLVSYMCVTTRM